MDLTQKIEKIIIDNGLSPSYFADSIGVQRSIISHILSGRDKPSLDVIQRILKIYPDINRDWLLFDSELQNEKNNPYSNNSLSINKTKQQVPKIVKETLSEIGKLVKEFISKSKIKIVAKSTDDYLLSLYPKNHEDFFFRIVYYDLVDIEEFLTSDDDSGISFSVVMNDTVRVMIEKDEDLFVEFRSFFSASNSGEGFNLAEDYSQLDLFEIFKIYLSVINDIYPIINDYEDIEVNLSNLFEIDNEEEELTPEPNTYESKEKILPYSLKQIAVKGFQGIKETEIENIPVDAQWVFLVGENGFGKTTILQSIFLGLNGIMDDNINLLDDKSSSIQVEYKNLEESVINNIKDNKKPLKHLAAYGPGRLNLQGPKSENAEDRNNSVSYNLFNSDGFLFNINADLERLEYKDKKRFNLLKRAIFTLIPNISNIQLNKETDQIEYIESEINSEDDNITYNPLPFKKLASGFKSIIALAGDMIVRLSKNQPEVKDPSELKGIVLIDEIDLHLHPKLQKQLIGQFSKVFPKIQFIVSTHSPIPLLGAESNSVILKVNRTKERGIQVEKVDIDLKNLTPNLVLTSGIFDMEDFISVQNENINEVRTEDSMTEMEENDKVAKYLEEFEKSDANFPDELFLPKTSK